jgi:hypothetical protein
MRKSPVSLLLLAALPLAACGFTDLEGEYEGDIDCGSDGSVGMVLDLSENGTGWYTAEGVVDPLVFDGVETGFILDLDLEQTDAKGAQPINVDEATCTAVAANGSSAEVDCSDFDELGFDGEDILSAEISNFLSTGLDCEMVLER